MQSRLHTPVCERLARAVTASWLPAGARGPDNPTARSRLTQPQPRVSQTLVVDPAPCEQKSSVALKPHLAKVALLPPRASLAEGNSGNDGNSGGMVGLQACRWQSKDPPSSIRVSCLTWARLSHGGSGPEAACDDGWKHGCYNKEHTLQGGANPERHTPPPCCFKHMSLMPSYSQSLGPLLAHVSSSEPL